MSVSFTVAPSFPVSGKSCRISFSASTGSRVRLFVTTAPASSKFTKELTDNGATRTQVYEGDVSAPFDFVPDVGGVYTFAAQEIQTPGFVGGFKGDTRAFIDIGGGTLGSEKILSPESTLTLYVGTRLSLRLGAGGDTATLAFWVWNDTIRATTVAVHGEATPAVLNPRSERAKTAARSSTVLSAVAGLVGLTAQAARGSDATLRALLDNVRTVASLHFGNAAAHANADSDNQIGTELLPNALAPDSLAPFMNDALTRNRSHYTNDQDGTGPGSAGSSSYHKIAGNIVPDYGNATLFRSVASPEEALNAIADLIRAHEAHRVDTTVHTAADNTYVVSATIPQLITVMRKFLESVAKSTPTAALGDSSGAALLKAWGAKEG